MPDLLDCWQVKIHGTLNTLDVCVHAHGGVHDGAQVPKSQWRWHSDCIEMQRSSCCFTHPLLSTLSETCAAGGWQESDTNQGCIGLSAWGCAPYQTVSKTESLFPWEAVECSCGGWLQWRSDSNPKNPSRLSYQLGGQSSLGPSLLCCRIMRCCRKHLRTLTNQHMTKME